MIPRIKTGDSFKGAALYYLHDKRLEGEAERLTTGRVAWTHALNTLENEPEAVIREMQHTAMSQQRLKYLSGNRTDGRPTERTVMTVSLAWAPDQKPDREQMIEAGRSFLNRMGWQQHQVLFVAHNDTKHPHVHLVINRIHPETGMTMDDKWFKTRAQKWALTYEREQGQIYCLRREARYGHDQARDGSGLSYREWQTWQEIAKDNTVDPEFRKALQTGEWEALKGGQRDARLEFWKETGRLRNELRAGLREDVRAEFAPQWAAYAVHRAEREEKAKLYDREARRAIRELRRAGGTQKKTIEVVKGPDGRTYRKRRGIESDGIEQIKERRRAYHAKQREELWQMRAAIGDAQKERLQELFEPALEKLSADRKREYDTVVLPAQRADRAELRGDQRKGERRYDVLQGSGVSAAKDAHLTPEQIAGYIAHARHAAARDAEVESAKREVAHADRARSQETARDPAQSKPAKETSDRDREKRDKVDEAKRSGDIEWYLAKRKADRARDRDGGRDR